MPATLTNLYALPQDIYDLIGTEGGQLRLDDHNLATGQVIQIAAAAVEGATALTIEPLQFPLLPGTMLEFDGGNMSAVVEVIVAAFAGAGTTSMAVVALPNAVNEYAQARDSGVNVALGQRLVKACNYGTSQVRLYCLSRYNDSQLAQSWTVNRWATNLGARWLCHRRGMTAPKVLEDDCKENIDEMKAVQRGILQIEGIGTRTAGWPFISNMSIVVGYDYARLRVEQPLSEPTITQYGQFVDWNSALCLEYF